LPSFASETALVRKSMMLDHDAQHRPAQGQHQAMSFHRFTFQRTPPRLNHFTAMKRHETT
jgi:hypothetical protein